MTDFVRAKSINVPNDWEVQHFQKYWAMREEATASIEKLGREEFATQMDKVLPIIFLRDDFYIFFETALSVPEVAEAIQNQVPYYYREPGDEEPDPKWGSLRVNFEQWWVMTHFDDNIWLGHLELMTSRYMIVVFRAFVEYFTSGDVEKSYQIIAEKLDNFSMHKGRLSG